MSDIETRIREAVHDEDVQQHVRDATLEYVVPAPEDDPLVSDTRVERAVETVDYVNAIHEHIDKFDGLHAGDVTEAAVAAVLPEEEETE